MMSKVLRLVRRTCLQENHRAANKVLKIVRLQSFRVGNSQGGENVIQIRARESWVHLQIRTHCVEFFFLHPLRRLNRMGRKDGCELTTPSFQPNISMIFSKIESNLMF